MMHPENYRDLGLSLALLNDTPIIPAAKFLRGGKLDSMHSHAAIGYAQTVVNLRQGRDLPYLPATYLYNPAPNTINNYQTRQAKVANWIEQTIKLLATQATPLYLHCTSGKDRTGIIVAALLDSWDCDHGLIIDDYLLSAGTEASLIQTALAGISQHRQRWLKAGQSLLQRLHSN